jgi:hypothetical protein
MTFNHFLIGFARYRHRRLDLTATTVSQAYFALYKTLHEVQNFNVIFGTNVTSLRHF